MGTTTEPPWINKSGGVSARNGTNTHTVPFGFTSTSGSLLVVVMFGAVTHTASGWTEQLSPVSSGELSVFTKTSAGDNSITAVHNGSNYAISSVVYEFPAGSTYVGGDSSNNTSETFPTLGLSGSPMLVIAARGRTATGTETGASTVWSGGMVEDLDVYDAYASGTDSGHLTVAHEINVTSTSYTPSATTTYTGTWSTTDRERVIFAIDAVAPSTKTPVTGSVDLRWQVRSQVVGTTDLRWAVKNTVTGSTDLRWAVKSIVTGSVDLQWAVRNAVTGSLDARWAVLVSVSNSLDLRWQTRAEAIGSVDLRWSAAGTVSSSLDVRWAVKGVVTGTLDVRWSVSNQITASLDLRWQTRQRATGTVELRWVVDGEVFVPKSDVRAYLSERVRSRPTLAQIRAYL